MDAIEAAACIWIVSSARPTRTARALRRAGGFVCVAMYLRFAQIQGIAIRPDYETRQIRKLVLIHQRRNLLGTSLMDHPVAFFLYRFKENVMQVSKIALALAAGAALVAASASFAAVPASVDNTAQVATQAQSQAQSWAPAQQNANTKITRAQVRQELVDAEHNGQLDALRSLYRGS
ncbi:DUF4148 domain-containing protein [Paraburkholderia bannensis]|uniref:DUF4148 domain-containing protein n=1 Tax=Paraburkholderia bannensis TaxID=765414 RepID=UPI002AB1C30A|nr:DUF4148 domain-containing protein [Paraburkholderia bannensis]